MMKIKFNFPTAREAVAYLEERGWKHWNSYPGLTVMFHDVIKTGREIYESKPRNWCIRVAKINP